MKQVNLKNKVYIQGVTMLATLFILIVLALAGVYMLKMGATSQQIINYKLLTERANFAALSALELAQIQWTNHPQNCPASSYQFDRDAKSLQGFDVIVRCQSLLSPSKATPHLYAVQLEALASKGKLGDRDYVNRKLTRMLVLESATNIQSDVENH